MIMTILDKREEKGAGKELVDTLIVLLKKKFKVDIIPNEIESKIRKAKMEQLRQTREDIFDITSLDEVLEYFE